MREARVLDERTLHGGMGAGAWRGHGAGADPGGAMARGRKGAV